MATPKTQSKIAVSVDLDKYFEDSIMGQIEQQIVAKIESRLESTITKLVQTTVEKLADKQFDRLAKAKLEEFFVKSHQKTDYYGSPTGESVSLVQVLEKKFADYLEQSVDDNGQPSSYSESLKRSQWMLNKLAHEPLQQAVNETVKSITAKAKEQIQASVSRYITEQLAPTISVPQLKQ